MTREPRSAQIFVATPLNITTIYIWESVEQISSLAGCNGGGAPTRPGPDPVLAVESVMWPLLKSYHGPETCFYVNTGLI